jgi:hypothetical protein
MTDIFLKGLFLQTARGLSLADGGGATWSFDPATNTLSVAIASGGVSGFNEAAQDAVFNVIADSATIDGTYNDAGNSFSLAVIPGGVNHNALLNYVADQHVAHSGVILTAGAGLTGGGDTSASRTFAVGAGTGITVNADDVALDLTADLTWAGQHTFGLSLYGPAGSNTAPTFSNSGDTNTGMYFSGAGTIDLTVGGSALWEFRADYLYSATPFMFDGSDSAATPGYTFYSDQNTGFANLAADTIAVCLGGAEAVTFAGAATTGAQTATFIATNKPGAATAGPALWLPVKKGGTTYYIPMFGA